jgi:predicted aspartyl protease
VIRGVVNSRNQATLRVRLRGPGGVESDLDAIVDSGCSLTLTLPVSLAATLGLVRRTGGNARLADGSTSYFDNFSPEVSWDGVWRTVLVSALGKTPLLGMGLMAGHKLGIEVVPGGSVEIIPLP